MRHGCLYGIGEHNQRHVKLTERLRELEAQRNQTQQTIAQASAGVNELNGAINQLKYVLELWSDDLEGDLAQAYSFSGVYSQALPAQALVRSDLPASEFVQPDGSLIVPPNVTVDLGKISIPKKKRGRPKGNGAMQPDA
jgi:uncharacterized coiled-coil protein SlyX